MSMTIRFNPDDNWPQFGRAFNHGPIAVTPHDRFVDPNQEIYP